MGIVKSVELQDRTLSYLEPQYRVSELIDLRKEIKKSKLVAFAKSVFADQEYCFEINRLLAKLGLKKEDVIQAYVDYDLDIYSYSNEIYDSLAIRFVMYLHSLLKQSWHQERQNTIVELIELCDPGTLVDMGFGEPTLYVRNSLIEKKRKITLCDYSDSAFIFSKALLEQWSSEWSEVVTFKKFDMETYEFIGNFDVYIFQDSIEHITNPAGFLKEYVHFSPKNSYFILSLPIGPITPSHYIAWDTVGQAVTWLRSCGLSIQKQKQIFTNPAVDLFADNPGFSVTNLFVLCSKS